MSSDWCIYFFTQATAVITNKRRRNVLKDLVKVLQQETYTYRDPITEFLEDLYVNFDFEAAQVKLRLCERVLVNDFFLVACRDEFMENARLCIFETYCRIHQKIDIAMLAEKLNMDQQAAERWIVNLIRNARLDAKIDSAANHVIMGTQTPSVYVLLPIHEFSFTLSPQVSTSYRKNKRTIVQKLCFSQQYFSCTTATATATSRSGGNNRAC